MRKALIATASAVAILVLTACGGAADEATEEPTPTAEVTTEPAEEVAVDGVVVEIAITAGEVSPLNERVPVTVGETVTFEVTSDAEDELHVHGEPEATFEVVASDEVQVFEYTPTIPGQIAVETHGAHATTVQLVVEP